MPRFASSTGARRQRWRGRSGCTSTAFAHWLPERSSSSCIQARLGVPLEVSLGGLREGAALALLEAPAASVA